MQTLKHGTYQQGYKLGCREQCCVRAYNRWSSNRYNQRRREGQVVEWIYDTAPVAARIELLRKKYGYTLYHIAKKAGVSTHSIHTWMQRPPRIKRSSANKVMSIPLRHQLQGTSHQSIRSSIGAQRRIQAMFYRGFTEEGISRLSTVDPKTVHRIRVGATQTIQQRTHDSIVSAFNQTVLMDDPQGQFADRARSVALDNGYLPYGVWDRIDDPDCVPDNLCAEHQDPVLQDAVERVKDQVSRGFMIIEIADVAGVPRGNLNKIVHGKKKQVLPETAKKIHAACDEFETRDEPTGSNADRARKIAKRNGWR